MVLSLILIKKFFPIFNAFLIFIFSILAIFLFSYFSFFLFSFLAILSSIIFLVIILEKEIKIFWPFLIILPFFIYNYILFFIFTGNQTLKIIFILFLSFFIWFIFEIIFRYLYSPRKYPIRSLESIAWLISLFIIFFLSSNLFALLLFLKFSFFYSLILIFLASLFVSWFIFHQLKISLEKINFLVVALITTELFYTFTFLPTAFYINGFLLTTFFYLMINFIKKNKEGELTLPIIKKHLLLAIFLLILIFILAKWR